MVSYVVNWDELELMLEKAFGGMFIRDKSNLVGTPKIVGRTANIPAMKSEFLVGSWTIAQPSIINGITYSQSGWKPEDYWELQINGETLFTVYTKEQAERKSFQSIMPVNTGDTVMIIHHNISGNSKQCWADLELLQIGG